MKKAYDPFLRVLVKRPGLPLRAEVVENTLRSMQELVDGPIAFVGMRGEDFTDITRAGERLVRQIVMEAED